MTKRGAKRPVEEEKPEAARAPQQAAETPSDDSPGGHEQPGATAQPLAAGGSLPPGGAGDPPPGTSKAPTFPVHEHIGRQLKAMFDEVLTQPVPDKFRELLEDLGRKRNKD